MLSFLFQSFHSCMRFFFSSCDAHMKFSVVLGDKSQEGVTFPCFAVVVCILFSSFLKYYFEFLWCLHHPSPIPQARTDPHLTAVFYLILCRMNFWWLENFSSPSIQFVIFPQLLKKKQKTSSPSRHPPHVCFRFLFFFFNI